MMSQSLRIASCMLGTALALPNAVDAAPITFNTALPVAEGHFVFREQFLDQRATDDPSAANRDLEVLGGISVLGYGVTSDLALFGILPYLDKELELTTPGGQRATRSTDGIADAQLFARCPERQLWSIAMAHPWLKGDLQKEAERAKLPELQRPSSRFRSEEKEMIL